MYKNYNLNLFVPNNNNFNLLSVSQFLGIIRNRMKLGPSKALFLLINNRTMISISRTVGQIYEEYKEHDGFLYVTYASQEVFG